MHQIIVIEDDEDLGKLLVKILSGNGFSVALYQKGENFLSDPRVADFYVIDINLGGVNGIDICNLLKTKTETRTRPVLIISAHPEIRKLASSAGADACLSKPFKRQELLATIQSFIA